MKNNNLGCGKEFDMKTSSGFICGVADAWGRERLCKKCDMKLRFKWNLEDMKREESKLIKGGMIK